MRDAVSAVTFLILLLATLLAGSMASAEGIRCRVKVDGERAVYDGAGFRTEDVRVVAQTVPEKNNRVRFVITRENPTKAAYVVAAFRDGALNITPEINGQQISLYCLRK